MIWILQTQYACTCDLKVPLRGVNEIFSLVGYYAALIDSFGKTYRSHLQRLSSPRPSKMGPISVRLCFQHPILKAADFQVMLLASLLWVNRWQSMWHSSRSSSNRISKIPLNGYNRLYLIKTEDELSFHFNGRHHTILPAVTQSAAHAGAACAQQARNKLADFRTVIIVALSQS
jgi:hypothetical protein